MNKADEINRLRDIVFEDADPKWNYAAMDQSERWNLYAKKPVKHWPAYSGIWIHTEVLTPDYTPYAECKNQPETFLDWTETLIEREVNHE